VTAVTRACDCVTRRSVETSVLRAVDFEVVDEPGQLSVDATVPGGVYSMRQMARENPHRIYFKWLCQSCRRAARPRQEQPVQLRRTQLALAASA